MHLLRLHSASTTNASRPALPQLQPWGDAMTKTPEQVALDAYNSCFDGYGVIKDVPKALGDVAAAVIAAARPQIEAEARAAMVEQCAQVCEDADDVQSKRDTYYAQLGDASATRHACAAEIRALAALPPTHQVVPLEPTEAMLKAAMQREDDEPLSGWGKIVPASHAEIYKAMLAASKGEA